MSKTPEQLYQEREKRINDAIALQKPDRVPVMGSSGLFAYERLGITRKMLMTDMRKAVEANLEMNRYFQPDLAAAGVPLGNVLEAIDFKQLKWAGHGLSENSNHQWLEGEVMKPEEYDDFLYDPSDFVVRKYWPRAYGKLGAFGLMKPLNQIIGYFDTLPGFLPFGTPEGMEMLETLKKAGEAALNTATAMAESVQKLKTEGFPMMFGGMSLCPFDVIGDFLRGRKGMMLDIYRRPDKIVQACEKLLPTMIEMGVSGVKKSGNPRVFIALHGCVEGFMSVEQFKRFYWPTFKGLMEGLIDQGCNPFILVEGGSTSRLEIMADVPQGKIWYWFENVDMIKAKKILGGKVCIGGNVPLSILTTGTPDQVRTYCKKLIDTVGKDGGYIMSAAGSPEDAKIENIKAMIDFTKEYGVY
jgi:uroporphyrinogen-III decarboxylase